MREGVAWCEDVNADAFLITLKKSDRDYSPTTMYRDFALSPDLFHWESQSTTSSNSPTGQRYIHHRERGSHILLFVRDAKTNAFGTSPYVFLGPAEYVSHEGDRPMAITWRLHSRCRLRCTKRRRWRWHSPIGASSPETVMAMIGTAPAISIDLLEAK